MVGKRKQRSKKKVKIYSLAVVVLLAGVGLVLYFQADDGTIKSIYVSLKPLHDRYQLGDQIDIEINTTRSDLRYSTDKWIIDIEICRMPDTTTPSEIIQNQSLAGTIASLTEYSGGYRQFIPVYNYSTEQSMTVTWDCTVIGIIDPNAKDEASANDKTYIAPSGYYFIYLSWYINDESNVCIINYLEPSSFFYLESIGPSIDCIYDSATKVVNYSVALINDLHDRTIHCDQSVVALSMDDVYVKTMKTDSNAFYNENYTLSPNSQVTKSYTMTNVTLTKTVGGSVVIYVVYYTSVGRGFCNAMVTAWS